MARTSLPQLASVAPKSGWLELTLDYRCNLRCLGCHACEDTGESMTTRAAVDALRRGRQQGFARLWLGGGEPTLRHDLLGLVQAARALGYNDVLLQTNGMRLSYATYREAVVAAGVTEVRVNAKSHRREVHDGLSGAESHALLLDALAGLSTTAVRRSADLLLTRSTLEDLPETVRFFAARGVARFILWLLSAADANDACVSEQVPSFGELLPWLRLAADAAEGVGVELASLHTPPCTLPLSLRHLYLPAAALGLVVTGPDGKSFPLESSAFEGGTFIDGCATCAARSSCMGLRIDYLAIHGASGVLPIAFASSTLGSAQ